MEEPEHTDNLPNLCNLTIFNADEDLRNPQLRQAEREAETEDKPCSSHLSILSLVYGTRAWERIRTNTDFSLE